MYAGDRRSRSIGKAKKLIPAATGDLSNQRKEPARGNARRNTRMKNKPKSKIGKMGNGLPPRVSVRFPSVPRFPGHLVPVVYGKQTQKQNGESAVVACSCLSIHPGLRRGLPSLTASITGWMCFRKNKANEDLGKIAARLGALSAGIRKNKANEAQAKLGKGDANEMTVS